MPYDADVLRDYLYDNWSLTGQVAKTAATDMDNPVFFFAHPQVPGTETRKAVEVRQVDPTEDVTIHPKFEEVKQMYMIRCRYTLEGIDGVAYDNAESNMQAMQDEVNRIIKTLNNPITNTGTFFRVIRNWENDDEIGQTTHILIRTLTLTLTKIRSALTTVYKGYGGVLVFDTSASEGDNKPASDYTYTEAYDVQIEEGFAQIKENIVQNPDGKGVPVFYRGSYSGYLQCNIYAKKEDIGSQTNHLNTIFKQLNNGEIATIALLMQTTNTESTPSTMTDAVFFKPTSFRRVYDLENLVVFTLRGELVKPSTLTIA